MHAELEAASEAFEGIRNQLAIVTTVFAAHPLVREACVKLLAQVLTVFGAIMKLRRKGRFRRVVSLSLSRGRS